MSATFLVGSYGPADDPGVHAVEWDGGGGLRVVGSHGGIADPSYVAVHPDRRTCYVVSETGLGSHGRHGAVHALRLDRSDGNVVFTDLGHRSTEGDHPCHLAVDPDGRWVVAANYGSGSISVFPIGPDGSLGPIASSARHSGSGPHPGRQEGPHAHATAFSPGGGHLVAADLGIDRLVVYRFDDGHLESHVGIATEPGAGPRHLVFVDGATLLVVEELANRLTRYRWDEANGTATVVDSASTLPSDAPPSTAAELRVHGSRVFVSNRGHDSVAVFGLDGTLGRRGIGPCGGSWPRGFAVAPGGGHLVVANRRSDRLVVVPVAGDLPGDPVGHLVVSEPACVVTLESDRG